MVPMVTTNLFGDPVFKDGGFTSNDRSVRRYALRKVMQNMDLAAELGAQIYVFWGGREGSEVDFAKDVRAALDRYREGIDPLAQYSIDKGYGMRFAIEPKPNEPRGDILLPTIGHALAFITSSNIHEMVGINPETGHEQMASLNYTHGIAQALWQGSCSTSTSMGRRARVTTKISSLVSATCCRRSRRSTCWRTAHQVEVRRTTATGTSTTSRCAPRTWRGCGSPPANMELYLILRDRSRAFRADPEVQEALEAARVAELSNPTLADGETYEDLLQDRTAFEDYDLDPGRKQGYGFSRVGRLAVQHLLGAR